MVALLVLLVADFQAAPDMRTAATMAGQSFDDSVVTNEVKSALLADPDLKLLGFQVKTRKGKVQLTGLVETEAQIDRAIAVVRGVSGVKGISIKIEPRNAATMLGSKTKARPVTTGARSVQLAENTAVRRDIPVVSSEVEARPGAFADDQIKESHITEIAFDIDATHSATNETNINK